MITYNIIYNTQNSLQDVILDLQSRGTTINSSFEQLGVINLSSDSLDFTSSPFVLAHEVDLTVIPEPSFEWHQKRIVKQDLPLPEIYNPLNIGTGVSVYLVDSGVTKTHPEFIDATIVDVHSYDGTFTDTSGHGTGIASLIVGKTLGVSPAATLKNVKIGIGSSMTISQILEAFNAILIDNTAPVSVINCSWTIPKSQILDTKILELQSAGFVVVAAAGNQLQAADNFSPVGLDTVLGVAASDQYDRVIAWSTGVGSNWGPEVDITAPGISVIIATNDGNTGVVSGTSLAAGVVSAVVAQFVKQYPGLTAQQIQNLLLSEATENILFRNETVYGTTPNRLVKTLFMNNQTVWDKPIHTLFPAKRGIQTTVDLIATYPEALTSIEYVDINEPSWVVITFPWITTTTVGNTTTLTLTPDETVPVGKYRIYLTVTDTNGVKLRPLYTIGVFIDSPAELDQVQNELYLTLNETGDTVYQITGAFCLDPSDCPKGSFCTPSNTCGF